MLFCLSLFFSAISSFSLMEISNKWKKYHFRVLNSVLRRCQVIDCHMRKNSTNGSLGGDNRLAETVTATQRNEKYRFDRPNCLSSSFCLLTDTFSPFISSLASLPSSLLTKHFYFIFVGGKHIDSVDDSKLTNNHKRKNAFHAFRLRFVENWRQKRWTHINSRTTEIDSSRNIFLSFLALFFSRYKVANIRVNECGASRIKYVKHRSKRRRENFRFVEIDVQMDEYKLVSRQTNETCLTEGNKSLSSASSLSQTDEEIEIEKVENAGCCLPFELIVASRAEDVFLWREKTFIEYMKSTIAFPHSIS